MQQRLSLTKNEGFARSWAARSGNEVAHIDLDLVANTKLDLSTGVGRTLHLGDVSAAAKGSKLWEANSFAKGAQEMLIVGEIDKSAVVHKYNPSC